MAGPEDWGAQPAQESPEAWGAAPAPQGLLAQGVGMLGTSEGRSQLMTGVAKLPMDVLKGTLDWFETPGKAVKEGLTPAEEVGFGFNTALATVGSKTIPRGPVEPVLQVAKEFQEGIVAPAAQRLDSYARTGDPNGVRLEPPLPETKPSQIQPIILHGPEGTVEQNPFAGVPRSIMAKTGIPEVDSILFHPQVQAVIDNPVVDRSHTIPYEAGASLPDNNPTTYVEQSVPKTFTVSRLSDPSKKVTFDTSEPTIIHENVEEKAMDILQAAGMPVEPAYKVSHFNIAEVVEHAWYVANDIDPAAAETEWQKIQPHIQHEVASDVPKDLFVREYPGADPNMARHEDVFESKPTPEEIAQAFDIIRNAPELQPKSAQPMLQQARELGVIGPDKPEPTWEQTPAERAFDAVPPQSLSSARTPQEMRAAISPHESYASYEARTKEWISRIDNTGDVQDVIAKVAEANSYFPTARAGEIPASHVAAVAEAAGLDPKDIDRGGLTTRFDSDGKVRAVIQALNQTTEDVVTAGAKNRENPSEETAAAMLEAELRQRHVLEYTLGARADSSRSLSAWKDAVRARERAVAVPKIKADEAAGKAPTGTADIVNAAGELRTNLSNPTEGKLGLQKLIDAAEALVTAPPKEGVPREPLAPDVAGLVDAAKKTLKSMKDTGKKGDAELEAFRQKLTDLSEGNGSVTDTADAAKKLIEATKKTPAEEAAEPKAPSDRGKIMAMAKRLVEAQEGKPAAERFASPELAKLSDATRVAAGYLKEGRVRSEVTAFRDALEQFKTTGKGADLEATSRSLLDALGELKDKQAIEPKALVEIDKITAAARKFVADSAQAARDLLPPDLKELMDNSKAALAELNKVQKTELEKTIAAAENQVKNAIKQKTVKKPTDALPPEWQELVDKADFVTKRFGGVAKGEEAAMLLARSGRTAAEQAELARSVEGLTPNQVARVLDKLRKNPNPHWMFWTVQQGLISGLITHTKYAFVNVAQTFMDRVIAPEVAAIIDRARGGDKSLLAPLRAVPAMMSAMPDAIAGVRQAFKTGARVPLESELRLSARGEESPQATGARVPYGSQQQKVNFGAFEPGNLWGRILHTTPEALDKAAAIIGVPGRSANALHTFFKIMNERASLASRAFELAEKEQKPGTTEFWDRYQYHLDNPTDANLRGAVDDGYSGTFMEKLGEQTERTARLIRNTPLKWLVFFTHIPFNMVRAGIKNSPLAVLNMLGENKMGLALKGELGNDAQNLAWSHVAIGTGLGAYFIHKALSGTMTPDYPTDPKEKQRWKDLNIQPNSMQVGDRWMSIDRLGPYAMVGRLAANYAHIYQNYDFKDDHAAMNASLALALGTVKVLAGDVGFETIRNIVDVMENPKQGARFAAFQLSTYAQPVSFVTQAASAMDPYMREANSFVAGYKYHIPMLRETLAPKRDPVYGEPIPNPGYHAILRSAPMNADQGKAELDRLKYYPAAPQRTIGHVKLTDEQYDRYEATAGPLVKQSLAAEVNSQRYQSLSDAAKTERVKGIIEYARAKARTALQMDAPHLIKQGTDNRTRQITGDVSTGAQQ